MTDQQRATICLRCGGLRDRCECAHMRRAAYGVALRAVLAATNLEEAADRIRALADNPPRVA
jgi:hypothetical protein